MNISDINQLFDHFTSWDLKHHAVICRADLNVPIKADPSGIPIIENDFRLRALLPTINQLLERKALIFLLAHLGRPTHYDLRWSTQILIDWFVQHGIPMGFCPSPRDAHAIRNNQTSGIFLLENVRLDPRELSPHNDKAEKYAHVLAKLGDYYLFEAFGSIHRNDTSLTLLPALFDKTRKAIGPLVHRELTTLHALKTAAEHPFAFLLGGGKPKTKIPLLLDLLPLADAFFLLPALDFTFLKALGFEVGSSLVADDVIPEARALIRRANCEDRLLFFPLDYMALEATSKDAFKIINQDEFMSNTQGLTAGPQTVKRYQRLLEKYKTIFINGMPGLSTYPASLEPGIQLLRSCAQLDSYTIVGGGDSITLVEELKLGDQFNFLSTGGGAALAVLANKSLPAITISLLE